MEQFVEALRNYADFKGRSNRQSFWMFVLFAYLIEILFTVLSFIIFLVIDDFQQGKLLYLPVLLIIYDLLLLIPAVAITVRRLHDTGESGLILLYISLLPVVFFTLLDMFQTENEFLIFSCIVYLIVNFIWLIFLLCKKSYL